MLRNPEAEAGGEQGPAHVRESEEEEVAAAEGIDRPDGGPSEGEVDEAETPGREKGLGGAGTSVFEDCTAVEGNNVDWD